jgi:hypothetical protein
MSCKQNACKQGLGYTVHHKDAAAQHARIRDAAARTAEREREEQRTLDDSINALLRADTEHLRPARKPT